MKAFEGLDTVKVYDQGMRYFATALTVPEGSAGDQDLVTLAAKVQDPTGAVMQGDIDRYNNIQVAIDYVPQWMKNQFLQTGKFTPDTRKKIIAFLRNRVETYRLPYEETRSTFERRINQFNAQLKPLGIEPIDPKNVLPGDPTELYAPKIAAYDKKLEADRIREERGAGAPRAGLLEGVPEGAQIAGRDITGWRLTPENEADLVAYARSPEGTAEGYGALLADKAVAEGHVPPSLRDDYAQRAARDITSFFELPLEQRKAAKSVDYSAVDKAASENAGLFQSVEQAVKNVPESGAQVAGGLAAIPKDVIVSALTATRTGAVKTFTDLAMELGQGNLDGPTTQALAKVMEDRYGSLDALQRTFIKDPVGLIGDFSVLVSGGGSAAARVPGAFGRVGEKVAAAGRAIDPLSASVALVTEGIPAVYSAGKQRMPGAFEGAENLPSNIVGFPSGSGGEAIREATAAGFERGATGAPTARSEAFTEGMRRPGESAENIVYTARDAIKNLRDAASQRYQMAMQQFGQNPTPLSIDNLRQRMAGIKPRN